MFFVCYGSKPGRHSARNLLEFGVARSGELEDNQRIVQDIHWFSSQSERAKNTIYCFSIYYQKGKPKQPFCQTQHHDHSIENCQLFPLKLLIFEICNYDFIALIWATFETVNVPLHYFYVAHNFVSLWDPSHKTTTSHKVKDEWTIATLLSYVSIAATKTFPIGKGDGLH